ncbi:lysophospholipase precursor [Suhomyces tanzawaensis NRRL Y-17324]|uniref:Lysophospholipase n=1 Tax=Suhomyces tanzawaensis NRRL Y-17324 TaxID=984487 RepID=A0A1E4SQW6_9ASCO|nr:lysophospholipase precursor [Suhomyces tanzawaensis NRRL Y-17324]ODV81899.1 lysophospholipase precursor [Suhomyces tanzawaensis NRRL Y-17324]
MLWWIYLLLVSQALATLPSGGYAPGTISCPGGLLLTRDASELSPSEKDWLAVRHAVADPQLAAFLKAANMSDFDVDSFLADKHINIALTFSGGGLRAMYCGAGQLNALDLRSSGNSPLKGILQASTYVAGLSGGSWLVGSLALQNFQSVEDILSQGKLWDSSGSVIRPYRFNVVENTLQFTRIGFDILAKQAAFFLTSITDIWGRALSHQLFNTFDHDGRAVTYSDIAASADFKAGKFPFPIVVADGRAPGTTILNFNSTVFEVNPFEIGSWDPSLNQFSQLRYLGTKVNAGVPHGKCYAGFDNAGFIVGTSSSLFNQLLVQMDQSVLPPVLKKLLDIGTLPLSLEDVAYYDPNPFFSSNGSTSIQKAQRLTLVDGGEDTQNVPLTPFLHSARDVDVLIVNDNSNDRHGWPDGTSLVSTYQRQFTPQGKDAPFPYVPGQSSFRNLNLTAKPTFFGCDAKNLSSLTNNIYDVPLVVYMANRPFTYWSNTSTFKLSYTKDQRQGVIANGYQVNSREEGKLDSEWAACVGCAIIRRQQERNGQDQSDQCKRCFQKYCWNGEIYQGEDLGDNFTPDGITKGATFFNGDNTKGIHDGGDSL